MVYGKTHSLHNSFLVEKKTPAGAFIINQEHWLQFVALYILCLQMQHINHADCSSVSVAGMGSFI